MSDLQFEFFDRYTPTYDDKRMRFALEDLQQTEPGSVRVVDVGCGDGAMLEFLAENHPLKEVVGVDPSPAYVAKAREGSSHGTFHVGSVLDPALIEEHRHGYDRVVMAAVLHHLVGPTRRASKENVRESIANCIALLRPGGRLYLFEPTHGPRAAMWIAFWLKMLVIRIAGNRRVELGPGWLNVGAPLVSFLSDGEVRALADSAGGKIVSTTVVDRKRLGGVIRRERLGYIIEAR